VSPKHSPRSVTSPSPSVDEQPITVDLPRDQPITDELPKDQPIEVDLPRNQRITDNYTNDLSSGRPMRADSPEDNAERMSEQREEMTSPSHPTQSCSPNNSGEWAKGEGAATLGEFPLDYLAAARGRVIQNHPRGLSSFLLDRPKYWKVRYLNSVNCNYHLTGATFWVIVNNYHSNFLWRVLLNFFLGIQLKS